MELPQDAKEDIDMRQAGWHLPRAVPDAQDAQDDAVRAPASGRKFFFRDAIFRDITNIEWAGFAVKASEYAR